MEPGPLHFARKLGVKATDGAVFSRLEEFSVGLGRPLYGPEIPAAGLFVARSSAHRPRRAGGIRSFPKPPDGCLEPATQAAALLPSDPFRFIQMLLYDAFATPGQPAGRTCRQELNRGTVS